MTKKALHDTEVMVVDSLRLYFDRPRSSTEDKNEEFSRAIVALSLHMLLDFHLQLNPLWPINKRWSKKLSVADISLEEPATIRCSGEINWGEMDGNKEATKSDSFNFKIRAGRTSRKWIEYDLTFGLDGSQTTIKNLSGRVV